MKVLVLGGMHGNEPLGLEVVRLLRAVKQNNVDTLLVNELAIEAGTRYATKDLNRSFPGDILASDYETKRAAEIIQVCVGYDVVLDFHNTNCPDNDCVFIGDRAESVLYDVAAQFELRRVIVADYDCLNKYAPNCVSIEISLSSDLMDTAIWLEKIAALAAAESLPVATGLEQYRFVYRMKLEDRDRLDLEGAGLKAFQPLRASLATAMGVTSPAYPIFIADDYTPYNFGGLLNKISTN